MPSPENLLKKIEAERARRKLDNFISFTFPKYEFEWFHHLMCSYLMKFYRKEIKNLMFFLPPQHGKSQIVSRHAPAWLLGKNPNLRIVGASYSADLSDRFNRDVQRIIDNDDYALAFPETILNKSNVRNIIQDNTGTNYLRNSDIFEIVGKKGSYKSVGVGGSLTGSPCDIAIIDDPVKDAAEANSQRVRDSVWEWYLNVLKTRLHNDSQTLLTMTRWHEDDLAGRIINAAKETGEDWTILTLPAVKENDTNPEDVRNVGEALWESKHSLAKLMITKQESAKTFASLYQQRPAPLEGGLIKRAWFEQKVSKDYFNQWIRKFGVINYYIDTAYTEKTKNDPSLILATCFYQGKLYIVDRMKGRWEFPEIMKVIPDFVQATGYGPRTQLIIEPKASGLSIKQQLKRDTKFNIPNVNPPKDDKYTRAEAVTPFMGSSRCVLVEGEWNNDFVEQLAVFPNGKHDEEIDCIGMAIQDVLTGVHSSPGISWG